ncbi:MAG: beta-N-acetylhexosaminidase [Spirochaetae bacterium HGW-Spirochaetae-1]|jgi:beta-N-acetylhexosaminidase|nr:MAG: beta-N-acetylhexosaminidase [Spirochaetae bacterium HGW-Spirochaetae-1]
MKKTKVKIFFHTPIILLLCLIVTTCGKKRMFEKADALISTLSMEQKIGQMLMVALPGKAMNSDMEKILEKFLPGGVIYFGYNLTDDKGIAALTGEIQIKSMQNSGIPVFVSVDQEGGRVVRITSGVTQFPGNMAAGVGGDRDLVFQWARILGMEMRALGINMNLAPVLDVNNNPENPVINTRSFGSDPELVAGMGRAYIKGLQESRCIAVGKHFPGHGDTNKDSHLTLPVIHYGMDRLKRIELPPFAEAIDAGLECVMTAHIAFPEIVGNTDSATISPFFLTDVLRRDMKFEGVVMTDDMEMNAISGKYDLGEAAVKSVQAGSDIILISSYGVNTEKIFSALMEAVRKGAIDEKRINDSVRRIIELKLRYNIMDFKENRVVSGHVEYSEKEKKLEGKAGEVNEMLSRNALYYYGRDDLLKPGQETVRVFVSGSDVLRRSLKKDNNDFIVENISGLQGILRKIGKSSKPVIVYYHIYKPDFAELAMVKDMTGGKYMECVLVSSGDPFPVTRTGMFKSYLLSFSNTDISLELLAECLNGAVTPLKNNSVYLGMPGVK